MQELSKDLNKKAVYHNILLGGMFGLVFDIPSPIVVSERLISLMIVSLWRTSYKTF